jgi:hypothetical protein
VEHGIEAVSDEGEDTQKRRERVLVVTLMRIKALPSPLGKGDAGNGD